MMHEVIQNPKKKESAYKVLQNMIGIRMSYWEISEGCIVNDDSGEHAIIKNGTSITVGENCWIFLIGLLNAKKRARGTGELGVLPDEIAYRSIWGNKQVDVLDGLTNVRKQLVKIIGTAALKKQNNVGYYFTSWIPGTQHYEILVRAPETR